MFENPRRGRQARSFTKNVPKILDLKSSFEQIFSENCRWVPLIEALYNSHLGDRRKWPLWRDGRYGEVGEGCNMTPAVLFSFLGGGGGGGLEYNMLIFQVHAYCTLQWQSNHK